MRFKGLNTSIFKENTTLMSTIPLNTPGRYITGQFGFPKTGTLPKARLLTGTYSSVGVVVTGTSSLFTTEIVEGDWLYNATTNELKRIQGITTDTILILEAAFSANASGELVQNCRTLYRTISISITGSTTAKIDSRPWTANEVNTINAENSIAPITYEASAGTAEITFDVIY